MTRFQRFLQSPFTFVYRGLRRRWRDLTGASAQAPAALKANAPKKAKKAPAAVLAPPPARAKATPDPVAALLTDILAEADYEQFEKTVEVASKRAQETGMLARYTDLRTQAALAQGKHEDVQRLAEQLRDRYNAPQAWFYLGESHFLRGRYIDAIGALQTYRYYKPADADAIYRLSESAFHSGQTELAWSELEYAAQNTKRPRTWLMMANLVNDQTDFGRMLRNWHTATAAKLISPTHKDVCEYVALGAVRAGNYPMAKQIWRNSVLATTGNPKLLAGLRPKVVNYSARRAEITLLDLDIALRSAGIEVFLVSGTLLGCVREGRLLGHDKDIDVGIWDDVTQEAVFAALRASGKFYLLASRSPEIIRVRHANGISVDVFYHYREPDDYWHSGVKLKWHNKPFQLVTRNFLGHDYLIPQDFDTYLTENYGDWRTPKIDFDSAYDTPNAEVLDPDEMVIHSYRMLLDKMISGGFDRVRFYTARLEEMGEHEFVQRFRSRHPAIFAVAQPV